jgi:hypothetical protein
MGCGATSSTGALREQSAGESRRRSRWAQTLTLSQRLLPRVQKSPAHMFGSRFEFYAKRVRSLSTDPYVRSRAGKLTVDASVLRAWAAQPELFPCLRELISLRGISTINCAQVLSEFCAMSAITSLTVPADTLVALAGSTARLWPSLQKLVVHDGSVDTSIREQWPRIFSETLTSASTLRHLELRLVVPVPDHIHLIASMRTLTVLKLWVSAVLPDLPSHAFPALRTLLVHEIGWSGGPQHVLRACSSKSLRDLDLSFISGCGGKDQVDEIREALSLIASHVHLCTLTLGFFMPRLSSTGQSEEFGPFLHALGALPHLEVITITSLFVQLALNFDDVLVALNCFPRLKEWHLRSAGAASSSELGKCAPVSLRQFLELLRHRPNIIKLPVAIASPELPCDDTLSSFGTHRCENVTIMAAGDTPEMQHIVQRLFPRTVPPEQVWLTGHDISRTAHASAAVWAGKLS